MLRRLLREPLLYFLLVGLALFALPGGDGGAERIVVTEAERTRLASQWQAQMGRPPSDAELTALIDQWVREEVYYREALALGLDRDDVIIRRRLAQKLTFLTEDQATAAADEDALTAHYQANLERYVEPARISFSHRYFSTERRQDAAADARAALAAAGEGEPEPTGADPFMLSDAYQRRSQREIGELFGRDFAAALVELPTETWQGPVRSAYGWHLVLIEARQPPRQLGLDEVTEQVAADLLRQQRRDANEAFYQSRLERYEIVEQ